MNIRPRIKVVVSSDTRVGRVTFNKVARTGSVRFTDLSDVVSTGQTDGSVLVYNANTNIYEVKTLPKVDGGTY
jgi:hypothetical protein